METRSFDVDLMTHGTHRVLLNRQNGLDYGKRIFISGVVSPGHVGPIIGPVSSRVTRHTFSFLLKKKFLYGSVLKLHLT